MPVMDFWKMNGAGNDFIILDNRSGQIPRERFPELARVLCRRRLSIGADGLMVVERPQGDADYRMTFYNADGSAATVPGASAGLAMNRAWPVRSSGWRPPRAW